MSTSGGVEFHQMGGGKLQHRRPPQPQQGQPLSCPRCNSANTKFCYYNNYSRSQPRYFCKACRRHWTKGGALRKVPVGGRRKAKRVHDSRRRSSVANSAASDGNATPVSSPSSFGGDLCSSQTAASG
ncbi:unnamed protein product [Spirodela intermedia]|uniref:Dof zinc finger protein n=1 Tax=Spirodela intermedia TaxID=51605 RepID=A0A7I8IDF4_SPIIN|nr:unnamed protein product [Spirodela intermedia]CAA6655689.1 unnamed protein product [Spirodela intermedia]